MEQAGAEPLRNTAAALDNGLELPCHTAEALGTIHTAQAFP